jgi:hypothetical protein
VSATHHCPKRASPRDVERRGVLGAELGVWIEDPLGRALLAKGHQVAANPGHDLPGARSLPEARREDARVLRRRVGVLEVLDDRARLGEEEVPIQEHGDARRERRLLELRLELGPLV